MASGARFNGPIRRIQDARHPTAGRFIEHARRRGYKVVNQASWPNASGWTALARPDSTTTDVLVRHYRDQSYTVQSCDGNGSVDELLADEPLVRSASP